MFPYKTLKKRQFIAIKNEYNSLLGKKWALICTAVCHKCVCRVKVDRLSRFCTGARQVFITQKLFPSEFHLTMKMQD